MANEKGRKKELEIGRETKNKRKVEEENEYYDGNKKE